MKKPNKYVTRLVIWSVSSSILTSSCTNVGTDTTLHIEELQQLHDKGNPAIRIPLSKEQIDYYNYIADLAQRLISDKEFAKEFNKDPSIFLQTRASANEVQIADDALMRITKALADDDIAEAIAKNDIKRYIRLMHQKGLLDNTANEYGRLLSVEEKKQLLESLGVTDIDEHQLQTLAIGAVVFIIYIAVIAVSYAAAAYTAVAAVNLGVGATVVYAVAAATNTKVGVSGSSQLSRNLEVYMLAENCNKKITINDMELASVIDDALEVYKEIYIEETNAIDLQKLKSTINLNLSKLPLIATNITIIESDEKDL